MWLGDVNAAEAFSNLWLLLFNQIFAVLFAVFLGFKCFSLLLMFLDTGLAEARVTLVARVLFRVALRTLCFFLGAREAAGLLAIRDVLNLFLLT